MGSYPATTTKKPWIETPLIESRALSRSANCRVFLKLELLQPSGAFKSRGIGNIILEHIKDASISNSTPPAKPLHFYSSSGGNAGLACVSAARSLGHKASVVVPLSTNPYMIAKIKAAGATSVIQHGESWYNADTYLRSHILPSIADAGDEMGIYIPPFDDPRIWTGVSTLVDELQYQLPDGGAPPDAIILSVGGGGLFCGVMTGLDRLGDPWSKVPVLAVETRGADSLAQSVQAGHLVTLPAITSLAKCLGAVRVADQAFHYAQRENVRSVVLEDSEAVEGVVRLADDERLLVEPACGVCLAVAYDGKRLRDLLPGGKKLGKESKVVVVVCGGSDVTVEDVGRWRGEFGRLFKRRGGTEDGEDGNGATERVVPSDVSLRT